MRRGQVSRNNAKRRRVARRRAAMPSRPERLTPFLRLVQGLKRNAARVRPALASLVPTCVDAYGRITAFLSRTRGVLGQSLATGRGYGLQGLLRTGRLIGAIRGQFHQITAGFVRLWKSAISASLRIVRSFGQGIAEFGNRITGLWRGSIGWVSGRIAAFRAIANRKMEFPAVRLTPFLSTAASALAVFAVLAALLLGWQQTRIELDAGPQFTRPELVSLRDHHPPAPPAGPTPEEYWALAGIPDIDGQGWQDVGFGARTEDELAPPPPKPLPPEIAALGPGIPMSPVQSGTAGPGHSAQPAWLANAVAPHRRGSGPMIAIVIDDAGVAQARTRQASELPAPLTIAFIPYSNNLPRQTAYARSRGHELMLHMPMEPGNASIDPGHNALLTDLSRAEILRRFRWALARFDGYVGVNNHMGSKFMADDRLVRTVLQEVKDRGLLFLDSRTSAQSAGADTALEMGMPHATRNVFLDHDMDQEKIRGQLALVERMARRRGHAIAIGHPHEVTVEALAEWIPQVRARGFQLVPISAIVKKEYKTQLASAAAAPR